MPMTGNMVARSLPERALEVLRQAGNPFRNYFARNPDDEVCARYHVAELYAVEREQLLQVVDLYRRDPEMHSEVVPVLGNKGAGKTHLLHSIKHGDEGSRQILVTPGVYQKDSDFLEYLLFQLIDTLLGGGKQKGARPLEFLGEEWTRGLLRSALETLTPAQRLELFPVPGLGRWVQRLGLGGSQAQERTQWLIDVLRAMRQGNAENEGTGSFSLKKVCAEVGLDVARACELTCEHVERTAAHDTAGLMRGRILQGFLRAALLGDETALADFLTFGFAELDFKVHPSRQELVLTLCKVLMGIFREMKIPVVVAFDQLEDLLLARRIDDGRRVAEAFFAGIVQAMHHLDGICFLIFAERGLWNRFVPSLDGYIQDRLNNPIHLPGHGTLKTLKLEAPPPELVRRVVEARLKPSLEELPDSAALPTIFPFNDEQIMRIARTESTLRDMLQQFRHLFDHLVYGADSPLAGDAATRRCGDAASGGRPSPVVDEAENQGYDDAGMEEAGPLSAGIPSATPRLPVAPDEEIVIKSITVVETPADSVKAESVERTNAEQRPSVVSRPSLHVPAHLNELWEQEMHAARQQLEPLGALTGAVRDLQLGLGSFLQTCHEHGVKVGPWRLQHVVGEWAFGDHPTYGAITIAHWTCKDGQPWKVGLGLFLGRGTGKPRDLSIKLQALETEPTLIDHLILLRPEDDATLSGKSKALWQEAERRGRHPRLEAVNLEGFATLYGFPRWLAAAGEAQPTGQPLPNLADFVQERCDKLLEQLCMPISK